jgi:ketosteroid isomerase-like protein
VNAEPSPRDRARQVLLDVGVSDAWATALDPDSPDWLREFWDETIAAYSAADVDRIVRQFDPDVTIAQPPELPGAASYRGHEGVVENMLDWPREWEGFRVEPRRVFSPGPDRVVVVGLHSGQSLRMGVEMQVEIVWVYTLRDGLIVRWDMFLDVEQALEATA